MIDIENEILNEVFGQLSKQFPKLDMASEYVRSPAAFPHLSLYEADNAAVVRTQSGENTENHASVMYEANVYSNKIAGKKDECREIAKALDAVMARMGFTRTMLNSVPNLNDASVYRVIARYTAVVSKDKKIYRR